MRFSQYPAGDDAELTDKVLALRGAALVQLTLEALVALIPPGQDGDDGAPGADGATIFTGSGVPSDASGADGDLYIRTATGDLYRKDSGTWGSPIASLVGPQGEPGADGDDGAPGQDGASSSWLSGSGAPSSGAGAVGDWYLDTASGDVYEKTGASTWTSRGNIKGPQGDPGEQGEPGEGGGAPAGTLVLLHNDETDSAEHASSTSESTARKTFTLPANSYAKIKIEAVVRARNDADLAADPVYTWRFKVGGSTVRTFTHTSIGITTTGADGGDTHVSTLSVIVNGGQGANTDLTITVQMTDSNAAIGGLVHAFRVYGVTA